MAGIPTPGPDAATLRRGDRIDPDHQPTCGGWAMWNSGTTYPGGPDVWFCPTCDSEILADPVTHVITDTLTARSPRAVLTGPCGS